MNASNEEPVLDLGRLDAITGGSAGLARELVTALVDEAGAITAEIRNAAELAGDSMRDLVHALKGVAGNVGAVRLQRAAEDLERADVHDAPTLRNCVARLDEELAALTALG
jgi:HPt (histidine-containing phosphotransfer) domain-containing protein